MSAPVDRTDKGVGAVPQSTITPNWTIQNSDVNASKEFLSVPDYHVLIKTVKVTNITAAATENDIKEFFSFSGDIQYVEMQRDTENTKTAYVTFKNTQGADTAVLLTGSNIANASVNITPVENYQLPPEAQPFSPCSSEDRKQTPTVVKKAEDVVSTMLAKGFVLGKDAIGRAKSFDERHRLSSNASAKVASLDRKIGLSGKLSVGTALVNEKVREMDEKFQVSEKTKSALAVAEQKASDAGSAIMSNPYVSTGALWVSNAINAVAKAAEDVTTMTKEKVEMAEVDKKEVVSSEKKDSEKHSAGSAPPIVAAKSDDGSKLGGNI